jgi:2-polyprenyl-3-methyl-5-hydroxy-6-metoxy-1,4-benzoquinol methylase
LIDIDAQSSEGHHGIRNHVLFLEHSLAIPLNRARLCANNNMTILDQAHTYRAEQVRDFFDQPENYLDRRRFDIRVRVETTQSFLKGQRFTRILDIGCGDGSISTPLLSPERFLTLLDIAPNMLSLARARVPESLAANVRFVNADFLTSFTDEKPYDVVICIGVLAHVSSPCNVIAKIASLLNPGGVLILESTDSTHFSRRLLSSYYALLGLFRPVSYKVTPLSRAQVLEATMEHGLAKTAEFRYSFPWPGMHRILSQDTLYRLVRRTFGDVQNNRNAWMGSEYIRCLKRR